MKVLHDTIHLLLANFHNSSLNISAVLLSGRLFPNKVLIFLLLDNSLLHKMYVPLCFEDIYFLEVFLILLFLLLQYDEPETAHQKQLQKRLHSAIKQTLQEVKKSHRTNFFFEFLHPLHRLHKFLFLYSSYLDNGLDILFHIFYSEYILFHLFGDKEILLHPLSS